MGKNIYIKVILIILITIVGIVAFILGCGIIKERLIVHNADFIISGLKCKEYNPFERYRFTYAIKDGESTLISNTYAEKSLIFSIESGATTISYSNKNISDDDEYYKYVEEYNNIVKKLGRNRLLSFNDFIVAGDDFYFYDTSRFFKYNKESSELEFMFTAEICDITYFKENEKTNKK